MSDDETDNHVVHLCQFGILNRSGAPQQQHVFLRKHGL